VKYFCTKILRSILLTFVPALFNIYEGICYLSGKTSKDEVIMWYSDIFIPA